MDADRFDAWTRRRVGMATGGAFASLLGLGLDDLRAGNGGKKKRRRRKKRCLKIGTVCSQGTGRRCCKRLRCDFPAEGTMLTVCCRTAGKPCQSGIDCCGEFFCNPATERCEPIT